MTLADQSVSSTLDPDLTLSAETIWRTLGDQIDDADPRNLVVMIGDAQGPRFIHEKGIEGGEPFLIASATKLVTAILILKLIEQGSL